MGRRLVTAGLACGLAVTGVLPTFVGRALADTVVSGVTKVDATQWVPDAPGLSGVAYRASTNSLVVVDMQNHDFAGFDGTNLWEYDLDTGLVSYTSSILPDDTDDPTGVAIKAGATPADDTLFVSSDSTMSVLVVQAGADGKFGEINDVNDDTQLAELLVDGDVEDPAYNTVNGHLYVLEGSGVIADINPGVDGIFGNLDDPAIIEFQIPDNQPGPGGQILMDVEGLAYDAASGNLFAAARFGNIYEFTPAGVFIQQHVTTGIRALGVNSVSGLTAQPAGGLFPSTTYWIAERGTDSTTVADGALYRVTLGPPPALPNNLPVLSPIVTPIAASEGVQVTFDANATDPNFGQTLTYSLHPTLPAAPPAGATINSSTGVFTWTPSAAGAVTVRVVVTDNGTPAMSASQDVVINVGDVNAPPVIQGGPFEPLHSEGDTVNFDFSATDSDGPQPLSWSATGLPPGLSIGQSNGTVTGTVSAGATAGSPYNVTVTVSDGAGTDQEMMQWEIANTNPHAPVLANITDKVVTRGEQLIFNATASDADGHARFFSLTTKPSGATITAGGQFKWTPNVNPGNYNVTVKVTDNGVPPRTDQQTFVITVVAPEPPDSGTNDPFTDDDGSVFENSIEWLRAQGITQGCNPPANDRFCPDDEVSRGQMAAFLVRALNYPATSVDYFTDDGGSVFENSINRLRAAGVTQGCNPPNNSRYCPSGLVTRGQMAAFLVRALDLPAYNGPDRFTDDNGHVFEGAIERLAQAGITVGCNPPANDRFCPNDFVTRGQMAAFLKRALGG
jgi:hypothetical protein